MHENIVNVISFGVNFPMPGNSLDSCRYSPVKRSERLIT